MADPDLEQRGGPFIVYVQPKDFKSGRKKMSSTKNKGGAPAPPPPPFQTKFHKQFSSTFPGLFKDSGWFFQDSKIHINPFSTKISILFLLTCCTFFRLVLRIELLLEFNRFSELSRTSSLFRGHSSPRKCHNKIPGLSRFSGTCTNHVKGSTQALYQRFNCTTWATWLHHNGLKQT